MFLFSKFRSLYFTSLCTGMLLSASGAGAVMDPRYELDPQTLSAPEKIVKPQAVRSKRSSRPDGNRSKVKSVKRDVYIVKSGDHLFKILMRDYGLSNNEAETFIEEIKRKNNIYDIKRLKIGQKISIPPVQRSADGSLILLQAVRPVKDSNATASTAHEQTFTLDSPVPALSEEETVTKVRDVWNRIVPSGSNQKKPLSIQTPNFSLNLDPIRYPTFARMDGGRIVLDHNGTIPPLVKSLIENKDSSVRIISEPLVGTKQFMGSLLKAAGFYSVEENFSMEFGVDPKLTVQVDFKVEKTAESLIELDIALVNSGRTVLPPSLGEFLQKEGYSLYEPFASLKPFPLQDSRVIHYISAKKQPELIDSILSAFSVSFERDKRVDVFAADNNGISLSVKAERYFERGGKHYVVTSFDGDPINYTLFRILETKGFNVIILEARDDFRKIAEKFISRMKIKGAFAQHNLLQDKSTGYSLQMSGFNLDDAMFPVGGIFLTNRVMDRIVRDLVTDNGFIINNR